MDFHVKLYEKSPVKRAFLDEISRKLSINVEVNGNIYNHLRDSWCASTSGRTVKRNQTDRKSSQAPFMRRVLPCTTTTHPTLQFRPCFLRSRYCSRAMRLVPPSAHGMSFRLDEGVHMSHCHEVRHASRVLHWIHVLRGRTVSPLFFH